MTGWIKKPWRSDGMVSRGRKLALGAASLATLIGGIAAAQAQPSAANSPSSRLAAHGGAAFAMTNRSTGNEIVTYRRAADGALTREGSVSTRGKGIGTDLDTQGGLRLSRDHRFLYAVNAGSDDVTVFAVNGTHLRFVQKVYAGDEPNSLTLHGDLLYVLDGSVAGNGIRGFRVASGGRLSPLAHSFRALSSPIAVPGTVQFSPDGRLLLVTEKTTNVEMSPPNAIDVFTVRRGGLASALPKRDSSHGVRPFSLAFRSDHQLVVAESFNAAPEKSAVSSYRVSSNGRLHVLSGSVRNHQTDTCWIVVTQDDRYAYTANFGSGTISGYRFDPTGHARLIDGKAAFLGITSQPVDLDLAAGSRYLYLLLRGTGGVAGFSIQSDGGLTPLGVVKGALPVADGASGLAVY